MLAVVVILIDGGLSSLPLAATLASSAPEVIILDDVRSDRMTADDVHLALTERECFVRPFIAVVPRRVRWLALLGFEEHQHRAARLAQPLIQRRGSQPSPSWHAAMLARRHQSNNLVTKPAWRARVPCYGRV